MWNNFQFCFQICDNVSWSRLILPSTCYYSWTQCVAQGRSDRKDVCKNRSLSYVNWIDSKLYPPLMKGYVMITSRASCVSSGDILLSINGVDLTQLTYNEAVSVLKAQTAQSQVVLRVIQTLSEESEEEAEANKDELDTMDDLRDDTLNWTPLWTRWLGLPRCSGFHYRQDFSSPIITTFCLSVWNVLDLTPDLTVAVTCTGAGTSSCTRPTTRAGASASSGVTRRATASSLSSSKPSCLVHPLTLTDASSRLTPLWPLPPAHPVITLSGQAPH